MTVLSLSDKPTDERYIIETKFADGLVCPHCAARGKGVSKCGKTRAGKQRFKCLHCGKTFTATTGSVMYNSKLSFSVWKQFLACFMDAKSLTDTADICGISTTTAFAWRHKLCDSLKAIMGSIQLSGIVEADETYELVSYKGNHKRSRTFLMPRKARKRRRSIYFKNDRQYGLSKEQVCIPVAVSRTGLSVAAVSGVGMPTFQGIAAVIGDHIAERSVICSDSSRSYRRLAREKGCENIQFDCKVRVKGQYHIQHVNNYHSRLKCLLDGKFRGVSTKHLNNYLVMFNFTKYAKETSSEKARLILEQLICSKCYTRVREIYARPAIPYICEGGRKAA